MSLKVGYSHAIEHTGRLELVTYSLTESCCQSHIQSLRGLHPVTFKCMAVSEPSSSKEECQKTPSKRD